MWGAKWTQIKADEKETGRKKKSRKRNLKIHLMLWIIYSREGNGEIHNLWKCKRIREWEIKIKSVNIWVNVWWLADWVAYEDATLTVNREKCVDGEKEKFLKV